MNDIDKFDLITARFLISELSREVKKFRETHFDNLESISWRDEKIKKLESQLNIAKEVIKFYENCNRLMISFRDLPVDEILGHPMSGSIDIMENGDKAREWLNDNK